MVELSVIKVDGFWHLNIVRNSSIFVACKGLSSVLEKFLPENLSQRKIAPRKITPKKIFCELCLFQFFFFFFSKLLRLFISLNDYFWFSATNSYVIDYFWFSTTNSDVINNVRPLNRIGETLHHVMGYLTGGLYLSVSNYFVNFN